MDQVDLKITNENLADKSFLIRCSMECMKIQILALDQPSLLVIPTPLEGEGTIYSTGFFFVQTILVDRYAHRREL